ncbi:transposase domain-containing protein, partial [Photobacterium phosphoreum]|uniref:transposase domain-containing protein n=1 Tax=Photobacterium phosphoreum TaxID=659 RepID=UPI001F41908D
ATRNVNRMFHFKSLYSSRNAQKLPSCLIISKDKYYLVLQQSPTGRKNWMFSTSVEGATASANLYSLVMTCRANNINPYYYFAHLFKVLPTRTPQDDLTDLMPWNFPIDEA